jgi:hypothetical protein
VDVCVPIAVGFQNFWTGAEVIVTGAAMWDRANAHGYDENIDLESVIKWKGLLPGRLAALCLNDVPRINHSKLSNMISNILCRIDYSKSEFIRQFSWSLNAASNPHLPSICAICNSCTEVNTFLLCRLDFNICHHISDVKESTIFSMDLVSHVCHHVVMGRISSNCSLCKWNYVFLNSFGFFCHRQSSGAERQSECIGREKLGKSW